MNAIIKPKLNKKQKAAIRDAVAEEMRKQGQDSIRKMFKLMCISLNEDFGFGAGRLLRVIECISELSEKYEHDEVYWEHVDKRLAQIGIPFDPEDYEQMERERKNV